MTEKRKEYIRLYRLKNREKAYETRKKWIQKNNKKYYTRKTDRPYNRASPFNNIPLIERFLLQIKIGEKNCWIWQGSKYPTGYGRIQIKDKVMYCHRLSFEIFNHLFGELPKDKCVCHSCDNPSCVNPEHLWLGTAKENTQDMIKKGRGKYGKKRIDK